MNKATLTEETPEIRIPEDQEVEGPPKVTRTPTQRTPTQNQPVILQESVPVSKDASNKLCPLKNCGVRGCMSLADHDFTCSECGLKFVFESQLKNHAKAQHIGKKVYNKVKKVLTAEDRRERREKNAAARNDARKEEKARVAKFVHPPQVFVRVRPLNNEERKESHVLQGLKTKTELAKDLKQDEKVAMLEEGILTGFEGVLGIEASNAKVYEATLADKIQMILRGGQVSMFCYGHTGTGKTHTSMGYREQPGLFKLACADILKELKKINVGVPDDEKLFIQVRFTEVHVGKVFDLLVDPKAPCATLEDDAGEFRLRRIPEQNEEGHYIQGDQKFVVVEDLPSLLQILEKGIQTRACGSSSLHDESSRSHAMMEMEIITKGLVDLREEVSRLDGKLTFGKNESDKKNPDWPRRRIEALKEKIAEKRRQARAMLLNEGDGKLGGTLTLADLAGADYDHRTYSESGGSRQESRESAEINKELFCLKECMRSDVTRKPWRESVLSKVLKKVLEPASRRETQSIVVATVSCAASLERFTLNTLRYAQQVAGHEDDKSVSAKVLRERDLKRQIRAVYKEHCPEKSIEEVEAILSKWAAKGKLTRLLPMVWAKYNTQKAKSPVAPKAEPIGVAA